MRWPARECLFTSRYRRLRCYARHDAEDQEDPVPTGSREHGGEDKPHGIKLHDGANCADRKITFKSKRLVHRHYDYRQHENQREDYLENGQIDDAGCWTHV